MRRRPLPSLSTGLALALAFTVLGGCGSDPVEPVPPECKPPPGYAADIEPLVARACRGCHSSELSGPARRGAPVGLDYDSAADLATPERRAAFIDAITSGRQPPPTLEPPIEVTADERAQVSAWRLCGYVD